MNKKQWCYSFDNTDFTSGTFEDKTKALQDAQEEGLARIKEGEELEKIYLATAELPNNKQFFPDASMITEHMALQAEDVGGEHANEYPNTSKEAEEELTEQLEALLTKWCDRHEVTPTFYTVSNSEQYSLQTLEKIEPIIN
jgi:hypothetical protein